MRTGQEKTAKETYDLFAEAVGITDEDRATSIPSGRQTQFVNRVAWAITYLAKAGLLTRPRRAVVAITGR